MRRNVLLAGVVVVAAIAGLSDGASRSAEAHAISNVQIIAQHSGKCLDIVGGSPNSGTPTHQWSCVGVPWQQWNIVPYDSTWHFIQNKHTLLCLDVPNAGGGDIPLWQYTCNYTDAQKFMVPSCAECWGEIRNKASNKCVDVQGAGLADGTVIWQYTCNGTQAQKWQAGLAYVVATTPFQGKWGSGDGYTDTRPWGHHLEECEPFGFATYQYAQEHPNGYCTDNPDQADSLNNGGHWSLDYYAASNTLVKFYGLGVGAPGANISARVRAIAPTCGGDSNGAAAGNTVFVDLHMYPTGQWYGWMSFGHLKDVTAYVSPGQWISANQVLGKINFWSYREDCWEVGYPNGVHTHIEMWNQYRYACYKDWYNGPPPINVTLAYLTRLGDAGRAIYGVYRSPCIN